MAHTAVWSMYEARINIWEQDPITRLKTGSALITDRLVRGLDFAGQTSSKQIHEPGNRIPQDHTIIDLYVFRIDRFFWRKSEQFGTSPLFDRLSTVNSKYQKRFYIEVVYTDKGETETKILKDCYSKLSTISMSDDKAALASDSLEFNVFDWA